MTPETGTGRGAGTDTRTEREPGRRAQPTVGTIAGVEALTRADTQVQFTRQLWEPWSENDDGPRDRALPELPMDDDLGDDELPTYREEARVAPLRPWLSIRTVGRSFRWHVSVPEHVAQDDAAAGAALDRHRTLTKVADLLTSRSPDALAAPTRGQLLWNLGPVSATWLSQEVGLDDSTWSRMRDAVIRVPAGLVTISFLTWLGPAGGGVPRLEAMDSYVRSAAAAWSADEALPWTRIEAETAATFGLGERTAAGWRDSVMNALSRPGAVRSAQASFPRVREPRLPPHPKKRVETIEHLFIAGWFDDVLDPLEAAIRDRARP